MKSLLLQRSSSVLDRWFDVIFSTYPPDTQRFLKKQKDRFSNPVGTTLYKEMENLYHCFFEEYDREKVAAILDRIIRIRAVQDFSPSEAVGFLFSLKGIIRSELDDLRGEEDLDSEFSALDSKIDDVVLLAFDIYMKCREKVFEIRVKETRGHVSGLLKKAGFMNESAEPGADRNES